MARADYNLQWSARWMFEIYVKIVASFARTSSTICAGTVSNNLA